MNWLEYTQFGYNQIRAIMIECTASFIAIGLFFKIGRAIYPYIGSTYIPQPNKYVVISGCTDGIGRQYSRYFNRSNVPMILIGRSQQRLSQLQEQLKLSNPANQHKILRIDFSNGDLNIKKYSEQLNNLGLPSNAISGFINCCGVSIMEKFSLLSSSQIEEIKTVNISSLQFLLKYADNASVISNPFIINLSSYTAHYPLKYNSIYSATKAYLSSLLITFHKENPRIKVLSVQPWFVKTKMVGFRNKWDSVRPEQVVQGSLKALNKRNQCTGTIKHELISEFNFFFQRFYFNKVIQDIYKRTSAHKELRLKLQNRKNAVKKLTEQQGKKEL